MAAKFVVLLECISLRTSNLKDDGRFLPGNCLGEVWPCVMVVVEGVAAVPERE